MKPNYSKICLNFLKGLPQRTTNVIERRFGLLNSKGITRSGATGLETKTRETLEEIGKSYNITRERVRQIEEEGFSKIQAKIKEHQRIFQYLKDILKSFGGFKKEEALLGFLGKDRFQNHVFFLLNISNEFYRFPKDKDFYSFWTIKKESVDLAKKIVRLTLDRLEHEKEPIALDKLFEIQKQDILKISNKKLNKNIFHSCLEISKKIQRDPEGQYGLKDWLEINPKGVKDRAYLVFKKEGKPLHFAEVATLIEKLPFFPQKKIYTATVHNELIKDPRFVLVGRGLYALKEWGYVPGAVKDIIIMTLKESKESLSKKEILERVLKQRLVKENTVYLNLQDRNYFLMDSDEKYRIKPAIYYKGKEKILQG